MKNKSLLERILSKVFYSPDGCWYWLGAIVKNCKYGVISAEGTLRLVHRMSYLAHNGVHPGDYVVMHTCDNRLCVNPNHLVLGTRADNQIDMVNKGRSNFGERNWAARLTESQVIVINQAWEEGFKQKDIAKYFGVSHTTINDIIRRKRWKYLQIQ